MGNEPQTWIKSKLIRFMIGYFAAIIVLTYAAEWTGRHGPALDKVFVVFGVGAFLYVALRLVAWYRRRRVW